MPQTVVFLEFILEVLAPELKPEKFYCLYLLFLTSKSKEIFLCYGSVVLSKLFEL